MAASLCSSRQLRFLCSSSEDLSCSSIRNVTAVSSFQHPFAVTFWKASVQTQSVPVAKPLRGDTVPCSPPGRPRRVLSTTLDEALSKFSVAKILLEKQEPIPSSSPGPGEMTSCGSRRTHLSVLLLVLLLGFLECFLTLFWNLPQEKRGENETQCIHAKALK